MCERECVLRIYNMGRSKKKEKDKPKKNNKSIVSNVKKSVPKKLRKKKRGSKPTHVTPPPPSPQHLSSSDEDNEQDSHEEEMKDLQDREFKNWLNFFNRLNEYVLVNHYRLWVPVVENDLRKANYSSSGFTVSAMKVYFDKIGRITLPPIFKDRSRERQVQNYINLVLFNESKDKSLFDNSKATKTHVKQENKIVIKRENIMDPKYNYAPCDSNFQMDFDRKIVPLVLENFVTQLRARMVRLCGHYKANKDVQSGWNKDYLCQFLSLSLNGWKMHKASLLLSIFNPERLENAVKELINDLVKNNPTKTKTLSNISSALKTETNKILKELWEDEDSDTNDFKNTFMFTAKQTFYIIFRSFSKEHKLSDPDD